VLSREDELPRSKAHKSNNSRVSQKISARGSLTLKDPGNEFIQDRGRGPLFFPGPGKRSSGLVHISVVMDEVMAMILGENTRPLNGGESCR
jgi:hypothetical protein